MLEIGGLGFLRAVRPSSQKLRGDVSLAIIDEISNVLWFWIGNSVQFDKRRKAEQKIQQISKEGHRIGGELLGQGLPVVVIDQDEIESPDTANQFSALTTLLEGPMEIKTQADHRGTLIFAIVEGGSKITPVTATPATPPSSTPAPTTPKVAPDSGKGTRFGLEAALIAILRVHESVHLELKIKGDTEQLIIESIDGLSHTLKRRKGKISFKWDPKTPKELKELVAFELKRLAA
jgi:hypothetical protein